MSDGKKSFLSSLYTLLKVIFFGFMLLQFIPLFIVNIKDTVDDMVSVKSLVGLLVIDGEMTSARGYCKLLEKFEKNENIRALILYFDAAPGGYPGTSQMLFQEVLRFKTKKPVVAVVENMCASGAYYMASAADKIIATPSAQIGSIGVAMRIPNVKELLDTWHVKHVLVQSGTYKMAGDPRKEITAEDLVYLQKLSDDTQVQFIRDVAEQRSLSIEKSFEWADGKCFTGNQALALSLIDQVGTYRDGIESAKMLAGIKDEVKIVSLTKSKNMLQRAFAGDEDDDGFGVSIKSYCVSFATEVCTQVLKAFGFKATQGNAELYL